MERNGSDALCVCVGSGRVGVRGGTGWIRGGWCVWGVYLK